MDKTTEQTSAFLEESAGQGFDGMGAGDYAIPFLKILQSGSPEVKKGPDHVDGAEEGMFFNSITKRVYGAEINLIPLKYESMWIQWAPNRGGIRGRCAPGSIPVTGSPFGGGMKDQEGNEVADNMIFYCLVDGHLEDGPIVFALSSSGLKHGKNWNTQIMMTRLSSGKRAPFFSSVWKLTLQLNTNADGAWFQIGGKASNVDRVRFIEEKEYLDYVKPSIAVLEKAAGRVDFAHLESTATQEASAAPAGGDDNRIKF